jgi:hypothetical protein
MIPNYLMTYPVEIQYRGPAVRDRYNLPISDASSRKSVTVKAYFRPRRSESDVDGGEQILAGMLLVLPPEVETEGIELVIIEGKRYMPDGQARPHWHPIYQRVVYRSLVLRRGTMAEVN